MTAQTGLPHQFSPCTAEPVHTCSQAAISSMRVCLSAMRRSRHWDDKTPSSDSARSSQLPCLGVMPFEALDQPPGFGGRERLIEGSLAVDVEVVLDQDDDLGVGEVGIGELFQDMSIVHGGVAIGDLDVAPAFERCEHHEEVGGAVTLVLVVERTGRPDFIGIGTRVSARSCFEVSSRQTSGRSGLRGRV